MMKRLYIILSLLLCFVFSFSQPITNRSNTAITVQDGNLFAKNSFRPAVFLDTTSANNSVTTLDSCGKMIFTYTDNSYWLRACSPKRWIKILKTADALAAANNGLSVSGTDVQLGQPYGAAGNPAALIQNTEIPMSGDTLRFLDGFLRIRASQSGGLVPVTIENRFAGASENLHIIGPLASIRMLGTSPTTPFAAITQYIGNDFSGANLRNSYGYDGPANHVFLCDLRNSVNSATFEINGSTLAGFSGITGNLWGGQAATPDTAALNLFRVGTGLTSVSQQGLLYAADYGSSYNTTAGALTKRMVMIDESAQRSAGGNNLTNVGLWLRARNAQVNQALMIDSGDVVVGIVASSNAVMNVAQAYNVANAGTTQKRSAAFFQRNVLYGDTLSSTPETFSSTLYSRAFYQAKSFASLPDNISGSGGEIGLFLRRNTAYSGAVLFQGATAPTNSVTTMPNAFVARFDMSSAQSGGNSIRAQGYWAGFSSWLVMNTGNSIGRFAWINTGAAQETGGSVDTGYAIYINPLPNLVTRKYAINQVGTSDSSVFNGIMKTFNFQADKTITTAGTTGDQTINKISGTVNFAASTTSLTVTNSLVTTNSIVICTVRTNDATAIIKNVVPGSGSFVITLNAAATAETSVGFMVIN